MSSGIRKGKWCQEEEDYVVALMEHFEKGLLSVPEGTTLRMYLAEKINCDPMRITKKFAGRNCIGKKAFVPRAREPFSNNEIEIFQDKLKKARHRFDKRMARIDSSDPCLLDFEARNEATIISSPAIDALINQSGKGSIGLVGESDLANAESPLFQLLASQTPPSSSLPNNNVKRNKTYRKNKLNNPMLPPMVRPRISENETPPHGQSPLLADHSQYTCITSSSQNSISTPTMQAPLSSSCAILSKKSSPDNKIMKNEDNLICIDPVGMERHHSLLTADVPNPITVDSSSTTTSSLANHQRSASYASFKEYNKQHNLDMNNGGEAEESEGADLLLGFFFSTRHSFSNLEEVNEDTNMLPSSSSLPSSSLPSFSSSSSSSAAFPSPSPTLSNKNSSNYLMEKSSSMQSFQNHINESNHSFLSPDQSSTSLNNLLSVLSNSSLIDKNRLRSDSGLSIHSDKSQSHNEQNNLNHSFKNLKYLNTSTSSSLNFHDNDDVNNTFDIDEEDGYDGNSNHLFIDEDDDNDDNNGEERDEEDKNSRQRSNNTTSINFTYEEKVNIHKKVQSSTTSHLSRSIQNEYPINSINSKSFHQKQLSQTTHPMIESKTLKRSYQYENFLENSEDNLLKSKRFLLETNLVKNA